MANIYRECAPVAQSKTHAEVMPVLIKLMLEEPLLKMQTQAASTVQSFVAGLLNEDEEEDDSGIDAKEILSPYCKSLLQALVVLLQKGIQSNYEPLQTEVLQLLSSIA